jgi:hypothetical protein
MDNNAAPSLIGREIDELYKRLDDLEGKGKTRRAVAYGLKIVAGGSALVIALKVFPNAQQWLGAAALIAVFIDTVSANYERMIGEIRAGYAAKAQRDKIARDHNRALDPIIKILRQSPPDSAEYKAALVKQEDLERSTHQKLQDAVAELDKALAETDLKALKAISLEAEKGKTGTT